MAFRVGIVSAMRVSSETRPSSSGTLKSTRTSTRLPFISTSRMVFLFMDNPSCTTDRNIACLILVGASPSPFDIEPMSHLAFTPRPGPDARARRGQWERGGGEGEARWLKLIGDHFDQIRRSHRVAPLVVVPGHDLRHVILHHEGQFGVYHARMRVALEVNADQRLFRIAEDTLHRAFRRLLEGGPDRKSTRLN